MKLGGSDAFQMGTTRSITANGLPNFHNRRRSEYHGREAATSEQRSNGEIAKRTRI